MPKPAVTVGSQYDDVALLLKSALPVFATSADYALVSDHDDLPGVILAAFAPLQALQVR